ncbi:unnamed protein product [Bursaphelenchus okinawaensis]|uniref:Ubiquinol-cytochrome c chaperone domain-containing protein n=1 Tax=Bursaphelenchus okinawaensis TaxID=465554 RepID=A0A811LRD9_9BILA|nr:unnamed protein product [Bursaphelenchus okinawaensis]CAG9127073.1 unnamed protein product [Bursaphelenchus okinawaensis]
MNRVLFATRVLKQTRLGCRTFSAEAAKAEKSLQKPSQNFLKTTEAQSYSAYVQKEIEKGAWTPLWLVALKKRLKIKNEIQASVDSELKALLDKAATLLYYDCANNYPYIRLLNEFQLEDRISSWYKITLLHICMCLFKMQSNLDAGAYNQLRDSMLNAFWFDVDKRLEILSDEYDTKLNSKKDMEKMHGVYLQALFEYDEGFLSPDVVLAGALWRNLFMAIPVEPVHLNNAVRYTRATIAFLDSIEVNEIIVCGVKKWEPAEQLRLS